MLACVCAEGSREPRQAFTANVIRGTLPMRLRSCTALLAATVLMSCAIGVCQQTAPPPDLSIRTTTRVVLVDAIVTDASAQPVGELSAFDFTVLKDGKPQKIAFFSFESAARQQAVTPPRL